MQYFVKNSRVRISARVRESTLAKTPANEFTRVQLDSRKLSDVSHILNTGKFKDSCKLHPGESKWTLVALYEILPLNSKIQKRKTKTKQNEKVRVGEKTNCKQNKTKQILIWLNMIFQ